MEYSKLGSNQALVEFLNQQGIPALPPEQAEADMRHWWEREHIERMAEAAIFNGYFFLAVAKVGLSLHVFNGQSDWYNTVRVWKSDVSETDFLQDLKSIFFSDDIYSINSHVWTCVRETRFDFEWQRTIGDVPNIGQMSPELKPAIFKVEESLAEPPKSKEFKQATIDLIDLFAGDQARSPADHLIMQRYFPPSKYERWSLPAGQKSLLREIGESFRGNQPPTKKQLHLLMRKARALPD